MRCCTGRSKTPPPPRVCASNMRTGLRTALRDLGLFGALLVAAALGAGAVPALDVVGLLLPLGGGLCLIGLLALKPPRRHARAQGLVFQAGVLATVVLTVPPFLNGAPPAGDGPPLRVYSKNLWYGNRAADQVAADILDSGADVVLLQELFTHNAAILDQLAPVFPHQHICPNARGASTVAVLSRHRFDGPGRCTQERALGLVPILWDGRRVWLASLHLPWLWTGAARSADPAALALLGGPASRLGPGGRR